MENLNMYDIFRLISGVMSEVLTINSLKRKLERGEELSEEEQERLLQVMYTFANDKLKDYKAAKSTKTVLAIKSFSLVCKLFGEKYKGMSEAASTIGTGIRNSKDNYNKLLRGVQLTNINPVTQNFTTLLSQYDNIVNYDNLLNQIIEDTTDRGDGYKRDFQTSISETAQREIEETRQEIISLSKKYI